MEESVVVFSGDGRSITTCNHAFLLLTGYARAELDILGFDDLFTSKLEEDVEGLQVEDFATTDKEVQEIPLKIRDGNLERVDLKTHILGSPPSAIMVIATPTLHRLRSLEQQRSRADRLSLLRKITEVLLESPVQALPEALAVAMDLLNSSTIGLYRLSSTDPDYLREGPLPAEFPDRISAADLDTLTTTVRWSLGSRPDHPLHQAARSLGLSTLVSSPIGTPQAWIGLVLAGWEQDTHLPDDVDELLQIIANLCNAAVSLSLQKSSTADAEAVRQAAETELHSQFNAVSDGVFLLDQGMTILRANPAAAQLLGYRPDELSGLHIREVLVSPTDLMTTFLDVQGHAREAERPHVTIHRRDGTPFPVHLHALPVETKPNSNLLVLLQDLSEKKAIEDQTETLAQRALLGEVAAIFAHEVRNPINNISTGLQLIGSRLGKDHPQYESIEKVRNECTRLDQLMEDVLFFARPLELKILPLDLKELIDRILARWEPRLKLAGVKQRTAYDPETPLASGDARTLEQVIVNLITNAVQAMPDGGTLSVSVEPKLAEQGRVVEIAVADTGPGIRQDQLDRIFDPFFTTKKTGTGLGLAISRRILMAHRGGIHVESFPDAGTVFHVQIPVAHSR
jgi:PAS domain S-box-containing protein